MNFQKEQDMDVRVHTFFTLESRRKQVPYFPYSVLHSKAERDRTLQGKITRDCVICTMLVVQTSIPTILL